MKFEINVPVNGGEARIVKSGAVFTLVFDDSIANTWEENFPTLPLALARLATLVACADEVTYGDLFEQQPAEFATIADRFFRMVITD